MNLRIITSVAAAAGLSLAACGDRKDEVKPMSCAASDGSAIPCPAAPAGPARTDGANEQHS